MTATTTGRTYTSHVVVDFGLSFDIYCKFEEFVW